MALESFPEFTDGNVKIIVLPDIYRLHSSRLGTHSRLLRQLFDRKGISRASAEHSSRCVSMNLVGSSAHKYGMLEMEIQGYDDAQCQDNLCSFPIWPPKARHVWSNIFKIFYNLPPILDNDGHGSILENCQALADLADELQSSDVVSRAIHTTLSGFDQQLYKLISQDPVSWIKIAVRIQSGPIFRESMIHLVGQWGLLDEKHLNSLPENTIELCTKKFNELNELKKATELQIVNNLPRPRGAPSQRHDVYKWMALTYYQQWLCQAFSEARNYHAPDGGAAFYRAVAAGGDAYLDKIDQDMAHYTTSEIGVEGSKGLKELKRDLDELKKGIRGYVSELLVSRAKYDPAVLGDLPYLTCCIVSEDEMPGPEVDFSYVAMLNEPNHSFGINVNTLPPSPGFFPPEPMMDGLNGNSPVDINNFAQDYLPHPGLPNHNRNHNQSFSPPYYQPFNAFTPQTINPTLSWNNRAMDFSAPALNNSRTSLPGMNPNVNVGVNVNDIYQPQSQAQSPMTTIPNTNINTSTPFNPPLDSNIGQNVDFYDMHSMTMGDEFVHNGGDGSMAFL